MSAIKILFLLCILAYCHDAEAALSVDGFSTSTSSPNISLSTVNAGDIIVLYSTQTSGNPTTGVSDQNSLTWTEVVPDYAGSSGQTCSVWWAYSPSALIGDSIAITGGSGTRLTAFSISGADTSSPFDPNGSLAPNPSGQASSPGATSLAVTISTTNANDMLLNFIRGPSSFGTLTRPSGFSSVGSSGAATDVSYDIVSSIQSSAVQTTSWTNNVAANLLFLAVKAAAVTNAPPIKNAPVMFRPF